VCSDVVNPSSLEEDEYLSIAYLHQMSLPRNQPFSPSGGLSGHQKSTFALMRLAWEERNASYVRGESRLQERAADLIAAGSPDADTPRAQIGISIENSIHRRLVEGVSAQLGLLPVFLEEDDLAYPERIAGVELLIADESRALRFLQAAGLPDDPREDIGPAVVAAIAVTNESVPILPNRDHERPFDGLLALPQQPAMVLAQLSVILYAHRAYIYRFESALEELHLNRRIFRSVTSAIVVASATEPDFPVTYVNPAFEVTTGYSLEEAVGKNCRFLQGHETDQPGLTLLREALREKRETLAIVRNRRKDGSEFWNELSLSPIRNVAGEVTHFVSIQNDVTSRIAFEEALRESEKLAAAGRLAASVAHEINNPLEAITNLLFLARKRSSEPEVEEYLGMAEKELHAVSLITAQSLRFYRQSTNATAVRPVDLISSVLDIYERKLIQRGITVQRKDRMSESIVCMESEIRQVISNLIRNAMDAMSGGAGKLLVRTREATDWSSGSKGVAITVADTGTGMSLETKAKIYKAFYSTKGIAGTGLGLWVSREIVDRHHGHLRVRSRTTPGRSGTTFELFLPYQTMVT
jgi:two-component system, sporulation sensor kinase C